MNWLAEDDPAFRPGPEECAAAARLGAPAGGVLAASGMARLLEAALAAWPGGRVWLGEALRTRWEGPIRARGGRTLALPDLERLVPEAADQVWLDLGGPDAPDPAALDAFLARAGEARVLLLRDDHPGSPRTQRLAVDRPGRVLLLREADGSACLLGQPALVRALAAVAEGRSAAPAPAPAGRGRLLVLDVDGVLVDPGRSFMDAVAGALEELAPGLAWGDQDYLELKRAGGFNNDFRLAAAALARANGGTALEAGIRRWEPACQAAIRRQYARTQDQARPLVTRAQLDAFPGDLAICTGRPPGELEAAFALLGFRLPAVSDRAPHLRKPRPEGLIQLADAFRAGRITFVGDSRDDAAALRGARELRPELAWRFAAVGPDRALIASGTDLRAATLTDLMESGELP